MRFNIPAVFLVILSLSGCGDNFSFNPTSPSPISRGSGPEIWIHPNLGSPDYLRLFTNPEEWQEAKSRITVFQFHHANVLSDTFCHLCGGRPDGGFNSVGEFIKADAFRGLNNQGIPSSIEAGSVKHHNCHNLAALDYAARLSIESISIIKANGGQVGYLSMDEPFVGGSAIYPDGSGCNYTPDKIAELVKYFIDKINSIHPEVRVGLIEVYPGYTVEELKNNIEALERVGYKIPFFHVDYDRYAGLREGKNIQSDMRKLRDYLRSKGIIFGLIIWGEDGTSTETWYSDAMAMATRFRDALGGDVDRLIIESWSDHLPSRSGQDYSNNRWYPKNLPETKPGTMTYMVNQMAFFFR